MHELLLHASVPAKRHHQVLSILAGLTAISTPPRIFERHYIYRPTRASDPTYGAVFSGASQQIDAGKLARRDAQRTDATFVRLVEGLDADAEPTTDSDDVDVIYHIHTTDSDDVDGMDVVDDFNDAGQHYDRVDTSTWTLRIDELPEPGKRPHVSRKTQDRIFDDRHDAESYIAQQGLALVTSFLVSGHYLVYNHVLLRFYRCMRLILHDATAKQRLGMPLGDFERSQLDGSGSYVLEASLRVEDGADKDFMARGAEELSKLKEQLQGCVDLRVLERLSLDTRLR